MARDDFQPEDSGEAHVNFGALVAAARAGDEAALGVLDDGVADTLTGDTGADQFQIELGFGGDNLVNIDKPALFETGVDFYYDV